MTLLAMSGCATMPTKEEIAKLDYGAPLTVGYEKTIKAYFEKVLFDPYSVQYKFEPPQQRWFKEPPMVGGRLYAGYLVIVWVNAKNRFGGYVGTQKHGFLFKNNQFIKVFQPEEFESMRTP